MFLYNLDFCMFFIINYVFFDVLLLLGIIFFLKISYVLFDKMIIIWNVLFYYRIKVYKSYIINVIISFRKKKKWLIYLYMVVLKVIINKN